MKVLNEQEMTVVSGGMGAIDFNGIFEAFVLLGFMGGVAVCGLAYATYAGYQYYHTPSVK